MKWSVAGEGGEHCFGKQVHLLSPVKLIGLVNREEEGGIEEREREAEMVRYNRELRTRSRIQGPA